MEKDDVESFMPAAGSKLPSQITTGYSRGPDVDSILNGIDHENMLMEISKYPVSERRMLIKGYGIVEMEETGIK